MKPQRLAGLWAFTKVFYAHVSEYKLPLGTPTTELSGDEQEELRQWKDDRESYLNALEGPRRHFLKGDGDPVLHPTYVLDTMGISTDSLEGLQASRKIYATNFAILLGEILTMGEPDHDPLPILRSWDDWFPQVFFGGPEDCGDQTQSILDMVIGVRTQRLIFTLRELEKSGVLDLDAKISEVSRIFCTETRPLQELIRDSQHDSMVTRRISFINLEGLGNGEWYRQHYIQRVRNLVSALEEDQDPAGLEEDYAFHAFLERLRQFVQENFERLKATVDGSSGQPWATPTNNVETGVSRVESQQIQSQIQSQLEAEALGHGYGSVEPR